MQYYYINHYKNFHDHQLLIMVTILIILHIPVPPSTSNLRGGGFSEMSGGSREYCTMVS